MLEPEASTKHRNRPGDLPTTPILYYTCIIFRVSIFLGLKEVAVAMQFWHRLFSVLIRGQDILRRVITHLYIGRRTTVALLQRKKRDST